MALPNIQTAQYGDRVALEKLGAVRRTNNPAADVNAMKDMAGGRPAETDPVKLAMRAAEASKNRPGALGQEPHPDLDLSPTEVEHNTELNTLADMYAATMKMVRVAQKPGAGPLARSYALMMIKAYSREFNRVRQLTPFFTGID